nr:hypothetical protein [Lachnospiraceae bacterium]
SETERIYSKYKNTIEDNLEEAKKDLEATMQLEIDAVQNFDYKLFINEFNRIVENHASKILDYKREHNDLAKIAFLIEIPISRVKIIGFDLNLQEEAIKGRVFPITKSMLEMLKKLEKKIDYIIISVMHENYKSVAYCVYAFDCNKSLKSQLSKIYYSFTYKWQLSPFIGKVKLKLVK